jgi:hypothetical protein
VKTRYENLELKRVSVIAIWGIIIWVLASLCFGLLVPLWAREFKLSWADERRLPAKSRVHGVFNQFLPGPQWKHVSVQSLPSVPCTLYPPEV